MPLTKQNIPIIFGKGLDTKTEEKVVQLDRMLELENAVFTKKMSLATRYGSDKLSKHILDSSSLIENPRKLMVFQDELLMATKDTLYSYISSSDSWSSRGSISSVGVTSKSIVRNTQSQSVPDGYSLKGVTVYAWEENSGIKVTVIDETTGLPILSETVISATGVKPKVISNNTYLFVYYIEGTNWKCRRLSPNNPSTFETAITLAADIKDNFDLHPHGNNIVYIYNRSTSKCNIGYIQLDGDIGDPINGFPTAVDTAKKGDSCVAIISKFDGDLTDAIYAFYSNTTDGVLCSILDLGLNITHTVTVDAILTQVRNITAIFLDSISIKVYYEIYSATTYNAYIKSNTVSYAGAAGTPITAIKSLGLIGKAFYGDDNNLYVIAAYQSTLQSSYFILRDTLTSEGLQVSSVVAKYEGSGLTAKVSSLCHVFNNMFPNLIKTQLQSTVDGVFTLVGIQETALDFSDTTLFQSKELGKNLHIAGGLLYDYDGINAFEHNFHFFPEPSSNSAAASGGNLTDGTRLYCFVYEWTDNQGQIHRSAPSIPQSVTNSGGGSSQKNTWTVPTLRVTRKCAATGRTEIRIVGYRTIASGTVYYRFTSQTASNFNDTTADTITVADTVYSDTTIQSNDVLYTTGGVLENYTPGSARLVEEYRNRLIAGGLEDAQAINYSKERIVNEAINFVEEFVFRNDSGKGGVTGISRLDEKLIIFKPSEMYYQIGQGPTSIGLQNDYQQPIFITTDVGTIEAASIVSMPLGIMFKSMKGFYLLTRSLEPIYIGQPVEKYNNLTVTSAILCDEFNEVRFTTDQECIVYNYNQDQWGVFKNKEAISAVLWLNKWTILKSSGDVFVEDTSTYFDGDSPVTKKLTTAWIQAASLQGAQRIYRVLLLGKLKSPHRLKIEICYDFDPSIRETFYYDTETILGSSYYGEGYFGEQSYYGGADAVYQVEIRPAIQKCQAIRFTLQDLNDNDVNGAGFEITGMTIQVGVKQGLFRPAISKRVGPSV